MKKSESQQVAVRHLGYRKLDHIIYNCSASVPLYPEQSSTYTQLTECFKNLFETIDAQNHSFYVVALIEADNETVMKEYLLKPWKRVSILQQHGEVFAVPAKFGLRGLSWLVLDHYYLFVHFTYDHRTLLRTFFSK